MDANDLKQVERYVTPDGTVHVAPAGLEEDSRGLLYLSKEAVNVEPDGKLTPIQAEAHVAAPKVDDVVHQRIYMYIVEPSSTVLKVDRSATLSQSPGGSLFSNGSRVADESIAPIVEVENKLFLGNSARQEIEIEIIDGKAIPLIGKQDVSFADVSAALNPKTQRIKSKGEGISVHQGANPISSFVENFLKNYRAAQKGSSVKTNAIDVKDLVDWDEAKSMGLSKEFLQKGGHLDKMLQGKKTNLLPITIVDRESDVAINTYARLSLTQDPDGKIHFRTNLLRNDLDLTQYCGHKLTDVDRANLSKAGNLGRVIEVKFKNDAAPKKILLSLDKQTNELIAFDAEKVKVPTAIAGKELTAKQQQELGEGKAVKIEGMKSASGSEYTNTLQFSALEKRFVFTGETPKIRRNLAGVDLTSEQHSKLTNGEVVQVVGMTDNKGKKYNAYVRWNDNEKRLQFSSNPNFLRAKKAIPTNEHKTQVAANNDGHKPKALEQIQSALEQKQPNTPTVKQAKQVSAAKPKATKMKIR